MKARVKNFVRRELQFEADIGGYLLEIQLTYEEYPRKNSLMWRLMLNYIVQFDFLIESSFSFLILVLVGRCCELSG